MNESEGCIYTSIRTPRKYNTLRCTCVPECMRQNDLSLINIFIYTHHPSIQSETIIFSVQMASRISTCQATVDRFRSLYGFSPQFVSVAPGRVNLIGEHVDHQGYSVLPAALNHTIQVAIGVQRTTENDCPNSTDANLITLSHANSEKFPPVVFKSADDLKVAAVHSWANYIIASLFGVIEYATDSKSTGQLVKRHAPMEGDVAATATLLLPKSGIKLLVDGAVPVVSSS